MIEGFVIDIGEIDINFSGIEIDLGQEDSRYIKPVYRPELPESMVKYERAVDLARAIDLDARTFALISGNFIFGDFIEALMVEHDLKAIRIIISTLSMSQENVDSLRNLLDGDYVDQIDLVVSDYFYSHERHKNGLIPYLYDQLDHGDRLQLAVAGSHCKIAMVHLEDGRKIVIHGSANLRSSGCMEQIMIEENASLYDFNAEPLEKILEKYNTIKKSIRRDGLWQVVQAKKAHPEAPDAH